MDKSKTSAPRNRVVRNLRAAFFVGAVLFLGFGPAYQQVFGRESRALRAWVMFEGYGINICQVKFHLARPDGSREEVRWLELLGYPDPRKAPADLRTIKGAGRAFEIAKEVRKHVPAENDLSVSIRISYIEGWADAYRDFPIPANPPPTP